MVHGLDRFREAFAPYADQFVVVGGTACKVTLAECGLPFRPTSDIDFLVDGERVDQEFAQALWDFFHKAGYHRSPRCTTWGGSYRWTEPAHAEFPRGVDLLAPVPDLLKFDRVGRLPGVPIDESLVSRALDPSFEAYLQLFFRGRKKIRGLPLVTPIYHIPIRMMWWSRWVRRWTDNKALKALSVKDRYKHLWDTLLLSQAVKPDQSLCVDPLIKKDMRDFLTYLPEDLPVGQEHFNMTLPSAEEVVDKLTSVYGLHDLS